MLSTNSQKIIRYIVFTQLLFVNFASAATASTPLEVALLAIIDYMIKLAPAIGIIGSLVGAFLFITGSPRGAFFSILSSMGAVAFVLSVKTIAALLGITTALM